MPPRRVGSELALSRMASEDELANRSSPCVTVVPKTRATKKKPYMHQSPVSRTRQYIDGNGVEKSGVPFLTMVPVVDRKRRLSSQNSNFGLVHVLPSKFR